MLQTVIIYPFYRTTLDYTTHATDRRIPEKWERKGGDAEKVLTRK